MNIMTTVALPPGAHRRPMAVPDLLILADRAMALSGERPSTFGDHVARDKGLIRRLRAGSNPRHKTRLAIQDHADELIRQARERAFATLIDSFERNDVEAAVDGLIAMLDARDGDPDLEDSETSNPLVDARGHYMPGEGPSYQDEDREPDVDDEPDHEAEPDHDAEVLTWPEHGEGKQPDTMADGLASGHDDDEEPDGKALRGAHRDRIRATRCDLAGAPPYPRYRVRRAAQPVMGFGAALI